MRRSVPLLLFLAVSLFATAALAQSSRPKAARQKEIDEAAVKAMIDGDYPRAIELLEESIELGDLNITWLNLGRAYAKAGRCKDALVAYDRMAVAPRVEKPTPDELYEILTRYRQELVTECPGNVIVRCRPANLSISIDGAAPIECPRQPLELAAGEHAFSAVRDGRTLVEQTVTVEGLATSYVELAFDERAAEPIADVRQQSVSGGAGALDIAGWSAVGVGAGMLIAAIVVDGTVLADQLSAFDQARDAQDFRRAQALQDVIETTQTIDLALYVTGASLLAVGTGLVIAAWLTADDESSEPDSFGAVGLTPDGGASFVWTQRF